MTPEPSLSELILTALAEESDYGYRIGVAVQKQSARKVRIKADRLYPALYELEGKGLIESYEVKGDDGRVRRYYRLVVRREGKKKPKAENLPVAAPSFTLLPESV